MISDKVKNRILNKIVADPLFKDRDLYQSLLTYLVKASISGDTPKEVTIAHDVFNKGKDFVAAEDTTVRVHIHHLRKMLEQYYQGEGKSDEIELYIPKGHYKVEFGRGIRPSTTGKKRNKISLNYALGILLTIALLYIIADKFILSQTYKSFSAVSSSDDIWGEFFKNEFPASVIIGDFLVFHEYDINLQRPRRIQDYEINSEEELNEYIRKYPEKNIESWTLGELPHNSIYNISDLQKVLMAFEQPLDISFTSEIDINFIKNRNIIYVGEFKNLRALSDLMSILPVKYKTLPWWHGTITFDQNGKNETLRTSHDWAINRYVIDLGMVAKLPGQNNENYLIIAGFGYNAQVKMVQLLCCKEPLANLENQIEQVNGNIPDYFLIVFEVAGFDRASTKAEIKFFSEINKIEYQEAFSSPVNFE